MKELLARVRGSTNHFVANPSPANMTIAKKKVEAEDNVIAASTS